MNKEQRILCAQLAANIYGHIYSSDNSFYKNEEICITVNAHRSIKAAEEIMKQLLIDLA